MVVQHSIVHSARTGRAKFVIAGGIAAMALFALDVTLAVLAMLAIGGTAGGIALFRGKGPQGLSRFFVGTMLGMVLYLIFAWYGTATSPPVLQTGS